MSSALFSAVEAKSNRPSEQAVSDQMSRWLEMVYEYFAQEAVERGRTLNHQEVMARVTNYLDSIQQQLETRYGGVTLGEEEVNHRTGGTMAATTTMTTSRHADHSKCGICKEAIAGNGRRYGLLKGCSHKFCEPCVRSLLDRPSPPGTRGRMTVGSGVQMAGQVINCPNCQQSSDRVVFTDTFHSGGAEKTRLFDSMVCLINGHGRTTTGIGLNRPTRAAGAMALRRLREGRRG